MKTDIFKVSNAKNTNVTPVLEDMSLYLQVLAGNHTTEDQAPEEYKCAQKVATFIEIDGKIVWDRTKEELPEDSEESWDNAIKQKFNNALNLFHSFPQNFNSTDLEITKNMLYGLNRNVARVAVLLLLRAYKFRLPKSKALNNKACHLIFPNAPDPGCTLKFIKKGLSFSYKLEASSTRLTNGHGFFELDTNDNLIKIKDPRDESKGKLLCKITVTASIDFTNFPKKNPTTTFELIIQSDSIEYCGPFSAPEIIKLESIQSKGPKTNNISLDKLIFDYQAYNVKFGILAKQIADLKTDPRSALSTILQLFNLVAMRGFWLKNNALAMLNQNNNILPLFQENDLREFMINTFNQKNNNLQQLYVLPREEFKSLFEALQEDYVLSINEIFQGNFISETLKSATIIKTDPRPFIEKYFKKRNNNIDKSVIYAIAHIVCHAIETLKFTLSEVVQNRKLTQKLNETPKKKPKNIRPFLFFENYLLQAVKGALFNNPFSSQTISPKILSAFLLKIEKMPKSSPNEDKMLVTAFQQSNVKIGALIEALLTSKLEHKKRQLSIIFVLMHEITVSVDSKFKLTTKNYLDIKFRKLTNEIITIFYQLNDFQISKLLRIFHKSFASGGQFLAIKNSARSYYYSALLNSNDNELSNKKMAYVFYKILGATKNALDVVIRLKQIEILSFKKIAEPKNSVTKEASTIFNGYLENNPFHDSSQLSVLYQFLSQEKGKEDDLEEVFIEIDEPEPEDNDVALVDASIPKTQKTLVCCANLNWSGRMALLETNPFTKAINDGLMLHFLFHQLFKLDTKQNLMNFLPIFDIVAGTIGAVIGHRKILNPNKQSNTFERIWESVTDGGIIFEIGLAGVINVFEFYNPQKGHVSDKQFFTQFVPAPFALFMLYSIWHSISPATKEKWFPLKSRRNIIENIIDIAWKTLFYSGVCSISALTLFNTPVGNLVQSLVIPGAIGLPIALSTLLDKIVKTNNDGENGEIIRTPVKNTANVAITYLMAAHFLVLLGVELYNQFSDKNASKTQLASGYIQTSYWCSIFAFSIYSIGRNLLSFPRLYKGDPDIIVRKTPKQTTIVGIDDDEETGETRQLLSHVDYSKLKDLTTNMQTHSLEEQPILNKVRAKNLIFSNKTAGGQTPSQPVRSKSCCHCTVL